MPPIAVSVTSPLPLAATVSLTTSVFAASMNTSRPVLSGVYVISKGDELNLVATDSYRLAERSVKFVKKPVEEVSCIVPAKTMMELGKIISKADTKEVKVNISKNQVLFSADGVELISRLIEGKFPDYEKIIQKEHKKPNILFILLDDLGKEWISYRFLYQGLSLDLDWTIFCNGLL